ncbi:unnamed protein product [Timema podura]|uniref:Ciliary BBSome complex subunit 2 N-terminal domain-containing protein n=1 Tax=Timema podura TaxID=61482 RepID=A0ABN7NXL8_TIMPD|nr:unnamed protein product [Timema podura]
MSVPVFTLSLGCRVLPGCVTVAKFDGSHCCLAAATIADKVVIHSPHHHNGLLGRAGFGSTQSTQELSTLNMSQSVTALCAGVLDPSTDKDMLVVGTATSLLAYNVDTNMELFYRENTCQARLAEAKSASLTEWSTTHHAQSVLIWQACDIVLLQFSFLCVYKKTSEHTALTCPFDPAHDATLTAVLPLYLWFTGLRMRRGRRHAMAGATPWPAPRHGRRHAMAGATPWPFFWKRLAQPKLSSHHDFSPFFLG